MRKILVIEDGALTRKVVEFILQQSGFEVRCAEDGLKGLELVQEWQPDLILCDQEMPGLDGSGVLSRLREKPSTDLAPFVLMTAHLDPPSYSQLNTTEFSSALRASTKTATLAQGANGYLAKPFTKDELLSVIQSQLPE